MKKFILIFGLAVAFIGSCYLESQMQKVDEQTLSAFNQQMASLQQ